MADFNSAVTGESRGGDYFQSKRAKDGFLDINPSGTAQNEDRTHLVPVTGAGSKGVDMPTGPAPDLKPNL